MKYVHKVHPRSRSLRLSISPHGEVVVTTPRFTPAFVIDQFVSSHRQWIETHQEKIMAKKKATNSEKDVLIFGKKYRKLLSEDLAHNHGVAVKGSDVMINTHSSGVSHNSLLERFLKNTATEYIIPRTHQLAKIMGITFNAISLKQQKTRWGSCSSQGNLNFNWRLVHAPPAVIDYVIIHELAHRVHMNHSSRFWNLVSEYDPAYLEHRGWLKRQGMSVG